jgi:NAD(P)-dependent dehydrogenase (short-subunit alcohol dehydrogenase family)
MDDLLWTKRSWTGSSAYAESKLCDVLLAFAVARRWKDVKSNALEPGWVATKMGGPSAPDDLHQGCVTQAWLATSEDELAALAPSTLTHAGVAPAAVEPKVGFTSDSSLEEAGFELLVPRKAPGSMAGIASGSRRLFLVAGNQAEAAMRRP